MMKRQSKEFYSRPLTETEASFAAEHLNIVWWYLNQRGLDREEWFDVVIFRYMLSVKLYLFRPELRQYRFVKIAVQAMRSAIGGEYVKRKRRPQEVSLFDIVPGTESLTYEDILASSN